jgi:hypothetical protein
VTQYSQGHDHLQYLPNSGYFCLLVEIDAFNRDKPAAGEERDAWLAAHLAVKIEKEDDARNRRIEMHRESQDSAEKVYDASLVRIRKIRQMEVSFITSYSSERMMNGNHVYCCTFQSTRLPYQ